jgi:hypothetical protein
MTTLYYLAQTERVVGIEKLDGRKHVRVRLQAKSTTATTIPTNPVSVGITTSTANALEILVGSLEEVETVDLIVNTSPKPPLTVMQFSVAKDTTTPGTLGVTSPKNGVVFSAMEMVVSSTSGATAWTSNLTSTADFTNLDAVLDCWGI